MPRYDYQCLNCQRMQEISHSIHETPVAYVLCECSPAPQPCRRMITTAPAVALKGYGFHKKDNLSPDEKYSYDHFDESGTRSEEKAMGRKIKDASSSIPGVKTQ